MRGSMEDIIKTLGAMQGRDLDDEEVSEIELWNKGRQLAQIVAMPGWTVLLEMLASYVAAPMRKLSITDPSQTEEVRAEQAVFFAANRIYNSLIEDVGRAVESSRKTPPIVKDGIRKATPAPIESMF